MLGGNFSETVQAEQLARRMCSLVAEPRPARHSEPKIVSISGTDTSSKSWSDSRGEVRHAEGAVALCCLLLHRIFEAGESDIGHGDAATGGVARDVASHEATTVRVAGLPPSASPQDVAEFLDGVEIRSGLDSVTVFSDAGGSSATAIVEVANETAQQFALSRNNQLFGNHRLLVSPLTASERAIVSQASVQGISLRSLFAQQAEQLQSQPASRLQQSLSAVISSDGSTLKLRGLPYSATVADILDFFQGNELPFSVDEGLCIRTSAHMSCVES